MTWSAQYGARYGVHDMEHGSAGYGAQYGDVSCHALQTQHVNAVISQVNFLEMHTN